MDKRAFVGKVFMGMEAIDGAKKVKDTYKGAGNNKYDKLMGVEMKKTPGHMGMKNAKISNNKYKTAFDIVNDAYYSIEKEAKLKKVVKTTKKVIRKIDAENTKNIREIASNAKNKDIKEALKSAGKASLVTIPVSAGMVGAGVGTSKALEKLDKTDNKYGDKNTVMPKVVGTALTGALALNAYKRKGFTNGAKIMKDVVVKEVQKQPAKIVEKTGPTGKFLSSTFKKVTNNVSNVAEKSEKQRQNIERQKIQSSLRQRKNGAKKQGKPNPTNNSGINKQSSAKEFGKHVLKDHFLKNGLESIPYYLAPASLSYALHRDLAKGFKKLEKEKKNKNEIPEKEASTKLKDGFKRSVERAADGLGRSIFPASISAVTGRNIMKSMEKIDNDNSDRTADDMTKIIINIAKDESSKGSAKKHAKKEISKAIDNIYKQAVDDESVDSGDIYEDVVSEVYRKLLGNKKLKPNRVHIGEGVKKQFQMIK